MKRQSIFINASMAIAQVIMSGAAMFVLYRYLLSTIGVTQISVWSLVLASVSVSRVGGLGLGGSVIKFVAKYRARHEPVIAARIIETSFISIGLFIGVIALSVYPMISWVLAHFISGQSLEYAIGILPYAISSLWLMTLTEVFQFGLDGCRRVDLRSLVVIFGQLLILVLAFLLVPRFGLKGLALSQVIQSATLLIMSWMLIKRQLPDLKFVPYRWSVNLFREMLGYGMNFQIVGIAQLLFEPVTKSLLTKFGGLAMVGYYEMANRMVMQLRTLLVAGNQVLVPVIADVYERKPQDTVVIYRKSYRLIFFFRHLIFV